MRVPSSRSALAIFAIFTLSLPLTSGFQPSDLSVNNRNASIVFEWQNNTIDPSEWDDGPTLEGSPMDNPIPGNPVVHMQVRYTPQTGVAEVEGEIILELFPEWVPITAGNFVSLVENELYDGIFFHRVIDDFVAQSGDPLCTTIGVYPATNVNCGDGGSGSTISLEHHKNMSHVDGAIGMARGLEEDSAESQFYLCDQAQHGLDPENRDDGGYATFGVVRDGMTHLRAIASAPTSNAPLGGSSFHIPPGPDRPIDEVRLLSVSMLGVVMKNETMDFEEAGIVDEIAGLSHQVWVKASLVLLPILLIGMLLNRHVMLKKTSELDDQ